MGYYFAGDYYTRGDGLGSFLSRVGRGIMSVGRAAAPVVGALVPSAGIAMGSLSSIAGNLGAGSTPQMGNPLGMVAPIPVPLPPMGPTIAFGARELGRVRSSLASMPGGALAPGGIGPAMQPSHGSVSGGGQIRGWRWDPKTGTYVRSRRRMNVLNPRALRRAIGRAQGFARFAKKAVTITTKGTCGVRFKRKRRCRS